MPRTRTPTVDAVRIAAGEIELEGAYSPGERAAAVVAPPHPQYGGRLDNPVVVQLHAGLQREGVATLRFNFRGTGASGGVASGSLDAAAADYRAALATLTARQPGLTIAAGYSFGAAAALRVAAGASVQRLLLVAPPLSMVDADSLDAFSGDIDWMVGDDDMFSPLADVQALLAGQPRVRLHVVAGADHFFSSSGLTQVAEVAALAAKELHG